MRRLLIRLLVLDSRGQSWLTSMILGGLMSNKLVRNEQRKLTGTFVNGVGIAVFAIGGLSQLATMLTKGAIDATVTVFVLVCVAAALGLHSLARSTLRGLEE